MSRKDYIAIAAAIQRVDLADEQRREVSTGIADALAADNGRFDRQRFLAACGVKP